MPEVRERLIQGLEPFLKGEERSDALLADVIEKSFPKEVMRDLRQLREADPDAAMVYVVNNLPGYDDEINKPIPLQDYVHAIKQSYATLMARGMALALDLEPEPPFELFRKPGDKVLAAGNMHKHKEDVTILSVSKSDGAATRFMDVLSLANDEEAAQVRVATNSGTSMLGRLRRKVEMLRKPNDDDMYAHTPARMESEQNKAAFEAAVARNSVEVRPGNGDLVLWSNHGRLWHQARRPEQTALDEGSFSRVAYSLPATIARY